MSCPIAFVSEKLGNAAVRAALIGGSLASGSLFWVRATLGQNQLKMHDCTPDGTISIGGVSEQLYGEGFLAAWHDVLGRELGARAPQALYEVGKRGAQWEVRKAIDEKVWVPALLRPLVGRPELLDKVRASRFYRLLMRETLRILFRMIMTEGGWGVVSDIDLVANPIRVTVANCPEARRNGQTGRCNCHLATGIYAGYFETIFGVPARAKEVECRSRGDRACAFELTVGPGGDTGGVYSTRERPVATPEMHEWKPAAKTPAPATL